MLMRAAKCQNCQTNADPECRQVREKEANAAERSETSGKHKVRLQTAELA